MKLESSINRTNVRVRYADTDKMGVAYNGIYLTWFEVGRTELLRNVGATYQKVEKFGFYLPLIEAGIKFLKPAHYDDILCIETNLESKKKGIRLRFGYIIFRDGEKLVTGFTEHVFTNKNLRPIKPPKEFHKYFQSIWEQTSNFPKGSEK